MSRSYLGRHELGRATERARRLTVPHLFLAQTIISHFDMSIKRQEDVIQLEIARGKYPSASAHFLFNIKVITDK
jgi:hypothetical protein